MIKNYIRVALKVLSRNKFFTFISLFGISFTLMVLMLASSFIDNEMGAHPPYSKKHNLVILNKLTLKKMVQDTVLTIDTISVEGGLTKYDSSYAYSESSRSTSTSSFPYYMLDQHFKNVEGTEASTILNYDLTFDLYNGEKKITMPAIYTDASYWEVFDFEFIDGRPFNEIQVENQAQIVVITEKAARAYFGKTNGVIGQFIEMDQKQFKIIGIVKTPNSSSRFIGGSIIVPFTNLASSWFEEDGTKADFEKIFLVKDKSTIPKIKKTLIKIATFIKPKGDFNWLGIKSHTFLETYAQSIYYENDAKKSMKYVLWAVVLLLAMFILLPTLNLINLNVSRILERSSEIGVRKAFGASSSNILTQFIFENIILTFIGGIIGFLLSIIAMYLINSSQILEKVTLSFNYSIFFYAIVICLFFGFISGLIPAFRMSKMQIVNALKQNQL